MADRFDGVDFYDIDSLLSEEERMVRVTIREWVEDRVMPIIGSAYVECRFPTELIGEIGALGILGANLPEEYGCAALNNVAYGLIMQELERGDSGIRSFASVQGALVMYPICAFGSEEQRRRWLPELAAGRMVGCFGLTEPDYGSNPSGMITKARETDGGWVLNGAKMWITNASMADVAVVWAQTREIGDANGIRGFVVPTDTPGVSARDQRGKLSLLASDTSELVLSDVELPSDALLPGSAGLRSPLMCLTQARYGIAWGAVGAAMACFHEALSYSRGARDVRRPHRRQADPAGAPSRHAHRDHAGTAIMPAARTAEGRGRHDASAGEPGQAGERRYGVRCRPGGAQAARREWHPGRVRLDAPHGESGSPCTPTRARTTSTRSFWGRRLRGLRRSDPWSLRASGPRTASPRLASAALRRSRLAGDRPRSVGLLGDAETSGMRPVTSGARLGCSTDT